MNKKTKGFTLIELLVVIAIIGILSSVVLASLNTARNKGTDAAIKAEMGNIRAGMEIWFDSNSSSYAGNATGTAGSVKTGYEAVDKRTDVYAFATATAYAISAKLIGQSGSYYCIDSLGTATTTTGGAQSDINDGICG